MFYPNGSQITIALVHKPNITYKMGSYNVEYVKCVKGCETRCSLSAVYTACLLICAFAYAEDITLLSPSHSGLSVLIYEGKMYTTEYDILFDDNKRNIVLYI